MTCREAIEVLADYIESTLTPAELEKLEAHLRECAPCRVSLKSRRRIRS